MSAWFQTLFNSSIIDAICQYVNSITAYIASSVILLSENPSKSVLTAVENLPEYFHCDEFQWKLLRVFAALTFINLIFIFIAWKLYGKQICDRFMKPGKET